jgi:hypothetical protein
MIPIREEDLEKEFSESEALQLGRQKGSLKKKRLRHEEKNAKSVTCSLCGQSGHNRHSCRNAM